MDLVRDEYGKIVYDDYADKYCDTVWKIGQTGVTRPHATEYLGYPTQKPEGLLRRAVESASDANHLVLD